MQYIKMALKQISISSKKFLWYVPIVQHHLRPRVCCLNSDNNHKYVFTYWQSKANKKKIINIKVLLIHISKIFKQILATKYRERFEPNGRHQQEPSLLTNCNNFTKGNRCITKKKNKNKIENDIDTDDI